MTKKALDGKSYGSIPHLPGSRLGPGDHSISPTQGAILTDPARRRDHDVVFVAEKVDGSCVGILKKDGKIVPLVRSGYPAASSPFEQHQLFHSWVYENYARFNSLLKDGERVCGEWMAQAHGIRYELPHEPFVAFDLMAGDERTPWGEARLRLAQEEFITPRLLHSGSPIPVDEVRTLLKVSGHGALEEPEGAVWRVERHIPASRKHPAKVSVDFLAKWVRPDKVDGVLIIPALGAPQEGIWNWRPGR